jgi:hypothetical protein
MKSRKILHILKSPAMIGLILIIAGLYWYGAVVQLELVNTDMKATDQSAYMDYARNLYESSNSFPTLSTTGSFCSFGGRANSRVG